MTKYRNDPAGVDRTLRATSAEAAQFETDLASLPDHVEAAAGACGNSAAIVPALSGFFTHESRNLKAMTTRIDACLTGAAAATMAYVNGDEEMMATYQANAARAQVSDIPELRR